MVEPQIVTVRVNDINNNNLAEFSPFKLIDKEGKLWTIPEKKLTGPHCVKCARTFNSYTDQEVHKAKPCAVAATKSGETVQMRFPKEELPYVKSFFETNKMKVEEVKGATENKESAELFVTVEQEGIKHFLQRLYFAQISLYNIEQWYGALEKKQDKKLLTAPTVFMPLDDADLKLLQKLYSQKALGGGSINLSKTDNSALSSLERRIANIMKPEASYFCRLSTRSPKDGGKRIEQPKQETPQSVTERLSARNAQLRVTHAAQVIDLLTRSARVFGDITNFTEYRSLGTASGTLNLILREWLPNLPHDREFRCYVHKGRLTAISQYHCYSVFPSLQDKSLLVKIRDAIVAFHDSCKDVFSYVPSYVFDVVVFEDFSVQIIELNSFGAHMSSGSGLYNWKTDHAILYGDTTVTGSISKDKIEGKQDGSVGSDKNGTNSSASVVHMRVLGKLEEDDGKERHV